MAKINKSQGLTASERLLAFLADRSFLTLWAYPNVYRDHGKELCDLLVVCGNHVLVFSDKNIDWPNEVPTDIAWSRWYRRAVAKSADQLHRAIRWIQNHPDRLFLNAQCTERFPIELPTPDKMKIHGIVVARGASGACIKNFGTGSGTLGIMPSVCRTKLSNQVPPTPFFVGNPCPSDDDVYHILDDISLNILLTELDTITDFTLYLEKRKRLIAGDFLMAAHGEEDLLAIYMKDINENGEHDFVVEGKAVTGNSKLIIHGGSYDLMRKRGEYKRKKSADRVSYVWDNFIESFAKNIISDTTYVVRSYEGYHEPSKRELALRHMALVSRLERRSHGIAIRGSFDAIGKRDRFFRAMLPGDNQVDRSTGFFILLLKRNSFLSDTSDEDYRKIRANITLAYAMNLLRHLPYLKRVIGLATEGELKGRYRSEDVIYAEQPEWTPEFIAEVEDAAKKMNIFKNGPPTAGQVQHIRPHEYPPSHHSKRGNPAVPYFYVPEGGQPKNRQQRRAARSRARKS